MWFFGRVNKRLWRASGFLVDAAFGLIHPTEDSSQPSPEMDTSTPQ